METRLFNNDVNNPNSRWLGQKEQIFEVSVFLFLIVPSLALSFFAIKQGSLSFRIVAYSTILRDLSLLSLILFFLWRNGEPVDKVGWRFKNTQKEIALGIGLFIPFFFVTSLIEKTLLKVGLSTPLKPLPSFLAAKGLEEYFLAFILVIIVALTEETIFRGYLILRFRSLIQSPALSVLLSAGFFSLGHGYEGSAGVVTVGVMGVIFALVYMWRQSLVAPIVIHFLQDFLGIVFIPLLGIK